MEKRSFTQRALAPAGMVALTMVAALVVYNNAWRIEHRVLHQLVANVFAWVLFSSIGIGACLVYPMAYARGASLGERVAAALATPLIWTLKEVVRVTATFTWTEALYFALNPLVIVVFTSAAAEMGLCEILCRWARKRKGEAIKAAPYPAVLALCGGLTIALVIFTWGFGVHAFYVFQEGYKALFGHLAGAS